ncbi:MAG: hypothetical protein JNK29_07055 [Anaerolineales bacterium]|nr:hypothetical protein [Anaerolineales bacterium]
MNVPADNAFTLHRDQQTGVFFPFGIHFWSQNGRAHLHLFPQTVIAVADILERHAAADITPPPADLLAALWAGTEGLTLLSPATRLTEDGLRIGVARRIYDFRYPLGYEPELWLQYDLRAGQWGLEAPAAGAA